MQLAILFIAIILFAGCASIQNKGTADDPDRVRVSGDVTVTSAERKGF